MSEPTDQATDDTDTDELDDPGRDPKGIGGPPRDMFSGGSQPGGDSGAETGPGTERDPLMPAEPDEDDDRD
jgi:hypothetical protein